MQPDWLTYSNAGAIRNKPLNAELVQALSILPGMSLGFEVFSGGQDVIGQGTRRTGSTRHDGGGAADGFFTRGGQRLSWENPEHLPILTQAVSGLRGAGITGIGAGPGYMQPGSFHVGFGAPAVWGAEGKGANAPDWLREAYGAPNLSFGAGVPTSDTSAAHMFQQMPMDLNLGALLAQPAIPNLAPQREERDARRDEQRRALAELIRY